LKRAAAKFGVAVARVKAYAAVSYEAGGGAQVQQPNAGARGPRVNVRSTGPADKITAAQKTRIGELAKALGHDRNWVERQVGCKAEEMNTQAARSLIGVMEGELSSRQQSQG
jgi:hypothetical protein